MWSAGARWQLFIVHQLAIIKLTEWAIILNVRKKEFGKYYSYSVMFLNGNEFNDEPYIISTIFDDNGNLFNIQVSRKYL